MTDTSIFADWMQRRKDRVEHALARQIPDPDKTHKQISIQLIHAMRYAVLNGGKRLRALLVYAAGEALNVDLSLLDAPAGAVEMMHTYSLVHDDMPIMDDDDLRRGMPACHKAYDDATALLVGDALQSLAFETLCDETLSPCQISKMVKKLAHQSGLFGMAGGQAVDLESVGKSLDAFALQAMCELKTGALIRASVALGALALPSVDEHTLAKLDAYACCIGLAFQVHDDILDVTIDTDILGKQQGADIALNKPTYPALLGIDKAREKADDLIKQALSELNGLSYNTHILAELARFIARRSH